MVIPAARFGDLSYGRYIYDWPVETTIERLFCGEAPWWAVFGPGLPVTPTLAFFSWHLAESPALRLKPQPPMPPPRPLPALNPPPVRLADRANA